MRDQFPEFYTPTAEQFDNLWADALFVLDANVLLDIYRFSPGTTDQLFGVLEQLGDRIWVPYQAALEYQRNRHSVSAAALDAYDKSAAKLDSVIKDLQDALYKNIDSESFLKGVRKSFDSAKRRLAEARARHAKLVPADKLNDRLAKLLDGKVGRPYLAQDLAAKQKLAEARLKDQIPPGFKDSGKPGVDKFGDVIVWFQLLDHAKAQKKPIVLVSGDFKEDWWWRERGKTIGPRPELRREALDVAGVDFYMYNTERFLQSARDYLGSEVTDEAIAEARDVQSQPEKMWSGSVSTPLQSPTPLSLGISSGSIPAYEDRGRNLLGVGTAAQAAYEGAFRNLNLGLATASNAAYESAFRNLDLGFGRAAQAAYESALRSGGLLRGTAGGGASTPMVLQQEPSAAIETPVTKAEVGHDLGTREENKPKSEPDTDRDAPGA
jgi:hypothetical protein